MKYLPAILIGLAVAVVFGLILQIAGMGTFGVITAVILGVFVGYLAANLQGTKAGPQASEAQRAAALSLRPSPGKALVVVYREGVMGMAAGLNITLDGAPLAQIKSPQFTATEVAPGRHVVTCGFGGLAAAQNKPVVAEADLREGETAVYRITMRMGALKNTAVIERFEVTENLRVSLGAMKMVAPAV